MTDPEEFAPNQEFERKISSIFQVPDPDQQFIDRLQKKLAVRFKDIQRSSESKNIFSRPSRWLDRSKFLLSPLAWGAIGLFFILILIWGIKTLIPKVEPGGSNTPFPSPSVSPSAPMEPTQATGTEGIINLPTLAGMPVPWPEEAINSRNADQITQLARWGRETISTIAWAPDGKSFAVTSSTGIQIYDSVTFQEIQTIASGPGSYSIAYSPDGTKLASSSYEPSFIKVWDVSSGSLLQTLESNENSITGISFSPEGIILATGSYDDEGPIKLYDAATGQELRTLCESANYSFAFSPDWSILATVNGHNTIKLWDTANGEELRTLAGDTGDIYGITFSPDGSRLASWSTDMTIKLWDVTTGVEQSTLSTEGNFINNVAILPGGNALVSIAGDEPISVWDIASGKVLRTFGDQTLGSNILLSPDGGMVLVYGYQGNAIKLYDIASGGELRTLNWQSYSVASVAISPDSHIIAAGLESGPIILLDATNGQELRTLTGHTKGASSLAFSPDGALLASGSSDQTTRLWDVSNGDELYSMEGVGIGWVGGAPSVDFSPDGYLLGYAGPFGQVMVWDVTNHVELRTLGGQAGDPSTEEVMAVAFSPDGKILASGYSGGAITLWDTLSGQELRTLARSNLSSNAWNRAISGMEFSPDGKILASGCWDMIINLWDVASGSELYKLSSNGEIYSLVFSPAGDVVAIGTGSMSYDSGSITLLDAASGKELISAKSVAKGLAFSPDGKLLVAGSNDGFIQLWGIAPANTTQQEVINILPIDENPPIQEASSLATSEEVTVEKIPIPILSTGENLQFGMWSLDGSYYYYTDQGPTGEPGPDQAYTTLYFLNARSGETCTGMQETGNLVDSGLSIYDRTAWMEDNRLLYTSPSGELMALTPCSDATDNLSGLQADTITSFRYNPGESSLTLLKGEQAYWLFSPSTRQSLRLGLPAPQEGMEISLAWSDWDPKLISSRLEDRHGELWIVLEGIDIATGSASLITEIQASPEIQNGYPMWPGIDRISKEQISIDNTINGSMVYDISNQTFQVNNEFQDMFGFEFPWMSASSYGRMGGSREGDFHWTLATGLVPDGQYYIYHPESGEVDQYPLDPPLLVVFPNGEGGIVESMVQESTSNDTYRVIIVDSDREPYDLVVKGHTPRTGSWSFATLLPDAKRVLFSSILGISLVDLESGEILNFWGLESQEKYQDFNDTLAPDGKTVVGFASTKEPGQGYRNHAMYWLRLEP